MNLDRLLEQLKCLAVMTVAAVLVLDVAGVVTWH